MELSGLVKALKRLDAEAERLLSRFEVVKRGGKLALVAPSAELKSWLEFLLQEAELESEVLVSVRPEGLKREFTFESFVVGRANALAFEAAREVARRPGGSFNPLFIYGGVGTGKTHLLQAIGNEAVLWGYRVVYVSTPEFAEEMVEQLKKGRISVFRRKYRSADFLLLDDVQFLAGKERTQAELFTLFNALYLRGGQVVLASDRPPEELKGVSERLVSRFEGGLAVEVGLDEEVKRELAVRLLKEAGLEPDEERVAFLVESGNARQMAGKVKLLKVKGKEALVRKAGGSPERLVAFVAGYYGLGAAELLSERRSRRVSEAKQVAMYLCRKVLGASVIEIGRVFGKNHSTVVHAIKRVEERRKRDRRFDRLVAFLEKQAGERL
ncbi:MAG: ATP-binding protein [Aquificae bacterium]|nr:ATP-binding protein [Aquificota bacterium]